MSIIDDQIALMLNLTAAERNGPIASLAYTAPDGEVDLAKAAQEVVSEWEIFAGSLDAGQPDRGALERVITHASAMLTALGADDESENAAGDESDEQGAKGPGPFYGRKAPALAEGERFQGNSSDPDGMRIFR
jgi:hypothetical protein